MDFLFTVIVALYVGIGLYEMYQSLLQGQPTRECILNGIVWPIDVWFELKQLFKTNFIDKDGP